MRLRRTFSRDGQELKLETQMPDTYSHVSGICYYGTFILFLLPKAQLAVHTNERLTSIVCVDKGAIALQAHRAMLRLRL